MSLQLTVLSQPVIVVQSVVFSVVVLLNICRHCRSGVHSSVLLFIFPCVRSLLFSLCIEHQLSLNPIWTESFEVFYIIYKYYYYNNLHRKYVEIYQRMFKKRMFRGCLNIKRCLKKRPQWYSIVCPTNNRIPLWTLERSIPDRWFL